MQFVMPVMCLILLLHLDLWTPAHFNPQYMPIVILESSSISTDFHKVSYLFEKFEIKTCINI